MCRSRPYDETMKPCSHQMNLLWHVREHLVRFSFPSCPPSRGQWSRDYDMRSHELPPLLSPYTHTRSLLRSLALLHHHTYFAFQALQAKYETLEPPTDDELPVFHGKLEEEELSPRRLKLEATTSLDTTAATRDLLFHPYESVLVVADKHSVISAYNSENGTR